jgi:predicted aspartyl protease
MFVKKAMRFLRSVAISALIASALAQNLPDPIAVAREKLTRGDLDGAFAILSDASIKQPQSAPIAAELGRVEFLRGQIPEADNDFKRALKIDDKLAPAWVGFGRVVEAAALREKAKTYYQFAWKLGPTNPEAATQYIRTLPPAQRLAAYQSALEKGSAGNVDNLRSLVEELKLLGDRRTFVPASPSGSGEIKLGMLMYNANRIRGFSVPVSVNGGKTLHLRLDTGFGGMALNQKAADAAGLHKIAETKFSGMGDEGDRTGFMAMAETVKIGEVSLSTCPILVSDRKSLADEDGFLGTDIFSRFLVTIDIKKLALRLDPLPPRHNAPADPDWEDREVGSELAHYSQFYRSGHLLLLPTKVNGNAPVLFLIDTGAENSMIDPTYARRFTDVRNEDLIKMKGFSGQVNKVESAHRLIYEFGHYRQIYDNVLAASFNQKSSEAPHFIGVFGVPTLMNFIIRIDYRDGMMDLEYNGPKY